MGDWLAGGESAKRMAFEAISRGVAQRPEVYGVSPADAATALRLVEALDAAMLAANTPATRTVLTLAAKRQCLADAEKFFRPLAAFIRLNPSINAADLRAIGIEPRAEKRRVPPPGTAPMLAIRCIIPGGHVIEFVDSATPHRRRKPEHGYSLELYVAYSPNNGNAPDGLGMDGISRHGKLHALLTRCHAKVIHPNERTGSVANYIGRWINARGEAGPFSQPVRMILAMPMATPRRHQ